MQTDPSAPPGRIRFGEFEVDVRSHELLRARRKIRLQEKSFRVLHELLKRPGQVVTREELAAALWPQEYFVDAEHGLNTAVRRLREALGDSAGEARYVETLPKVGYRFIGAIEDESALPADPRATGTAPASAAEIPPILSAAGAESPFSDGPEEPIPEPSFRRGPLVVAATLVAVAVAIAGILGARARTARPENATAATAPESAAVDELLARSRYLRNHKRFDEAKAFVEKALELDPGNAEALAGLSLSLIGAGELAQSRETALRALEIDPNAWEAHRALGVLARGVDDMAGAERHFRRAVESNPTDYKSRNRFGRFLLEIGRFDEAKEQMVESKRLAPDDPDVQNIWIEYALRTGDYEGAMRQGEIWTAVWEKSYPAESVREVIGLALVGARRHEEAIDLFRALGSGFELSVALALAHAGRIDETRAILEAHERARSASRTVTAPEDAGEDGSLAMVDIALGDFDRAFFHLERQLAARSFPGWLHCRLFDPIRQDARWPEFAQRLQREFFTGKQSPRSSLVSPERSPAQAGPPRFMRR